MKHYFYDENNNSFMKKQDQNDPTKTNPCQHDSAPSKFLTPTNDPGQLGSEHVVTITIEVQKGKILKNITKN